VDASAKEIGAVNTVVIEGDELRGFNTDAEAFINPLRQKFGSLAGARCAIVGAGGVSKSAIWALKKEGAAVGLFARDAGAAKPVAQKFAITCQALDVANFENFDIVINATPIGTAGQSEDESVVQAAQLRGVRLVYDLVYNPIETRLMREARAAGCQTLGGLEMLIAQAMEQFRLWTGVEAPEDAMRKAALDALTGSDEELP